MTTDLATIWGELEANPPAGPASGRRRLGTSAVDLYATVTSSGVRGVALDLSRAIAEQIEELPASREIDHVRYASPGDPDRWTLELRLKDQAAEDLFAAVAADIVEVTTGAANDDEAKHRWLARVGRWQRLLASVPRGLGPERQRGLFAELLVLCNDLAPHVGIEAAVQGWEGPRGGHDFQLRGGAFEVKSSAAHQPQVVIVSSERQLDETGTDGLHLVHISLDVHQHAGTTLPEMVQQARDLASGTIAEAELADRLIDADYADIHADRYRRTGYSVREQNYFEIREGFPRIVEADLPDGVGGVRYSLVIASCRPFAVERDAALGGDVGGQDDDGA